MGTLKVRAVYYSLTEMFVLFCLFGFCFSVPVQVIAWKDSSPNFQNEYYDVSFGT